MTDVAVPPPRKPAKGVPLVIQRIALAGGFLLLWQIAASGVPSYVFPRPAATWAAIEHLFTTGVVWGHLGATLYRIVVGFLLAAAIGVPIGLLLGSSRRLGTFFSPVLPVMNSVSSAIWSLMAVVWFGLSDATPIFVVLTTGLPLIITNVWQGTKNVNADWLELASSVHMPKHKVLAKVYLPAVLPDFFSGARLAFGFGSRVSLVAEALGSSYGVGFMIVRAADLLQMSHVIAWSVILIATIALIESVVIRPAERHLFRWRKEAGL
ncbi:ABC transporter permease [Aquabacter spiritensis]|uniref:NitT/TauT family transport system permease protein n=1 Tax=Aquabacter spiritensis TaxID=933073 RepID=A0A4R3LV04_9HYPH|nr:ABC transporter permease [Aquabacter spiritensis]TCT04383.1 NitT/TauT family transport system permease protein [Aquabacter spiritensis]